MLLIFSLALAFTMDLSSYMQKQKLLKILAEDCAEAGALCIDERSANIDRQTALRAAEKILNSSDLFPKGTAEIESLEITEGGKGVRVRLVYKEEGMLGPFLPGISSISRISEYVWE